MGLSLSILSSSWKEILNNDIFGFAYDEDEVIVRSISFSRKDGEMIVRNISFKKNDFENSLMNDGSKDDSEIMVRSISFSRKDGEMMVRNISFKKDMDMEEDLKSDDSGNRVMEKLMSFKNWEPIKLNVPEFAFKNLVLDTKNFSSLTFKNKDELRKTSPVVSFPEPEIMYSPRPLSELDAAAVKLQKVYKSYRTRRNLADCAVVVEELWWKALDFAALKRSSVSFFNIEKHETAVSRWARARTRAAKVGKGLSKDEKAQKLALQHWLEAIDPRHRYGHNLHFYYDIWFDCGSTQPFFYWLDVGDGKEVNVEKCPRTVLQRQCIEYLGPIERESYEVIVESGKLVYKQSGVAVNTVGGSKWIFVLSTSRSLYVGQKKKGVFQHSSFLSGGATTAAGRLVAQEGVLEAIWPYSGHYLPTEENFKEFISFLEEHHVDLTDVKRCAADDDSPSLPSSFKVTEGEEEPKPEPVEVPTTSSPSDDSNASEVHEPTDSVTPAADQKEQNRPFNLGQRLSCKWSTGTGPRIGCVRDYPSELRFRALEQVNLSPRVTPGHFGNSGPIPSPRPSPKIRLSPRLAYMGLPSPRASTSTSN